MRNRRIAAIVLAVAMVCMTVAATSASARPQQAGTATTQAAKKAAAGGIFRVEWESSFDFTDGFDPTGEYLGEAFGIYSNLLVRTLVGYNHVAGAPGNVLVPDLATNLGAITNGGKTYTFHLKRGIKFGPPLNREITSKDILFAFERIGTKTVGAQYGFYYDVIKGMTAFKAGKAKIISGIKTPTRARSSSTLTKPTGDFRYRLAMPAAGPHAAGGRRAASRRPNAVRPLRHLVGPVHDRRLGQAERGELRHDQGVGRRSRASTARSTLDLVRNPAYDAATDSPKARENLPDEFTFTVNSNADDIYARSRAATSRKRSPASRRPSCASTRARRSCTRTTATAPGTSR